MTPKDVKESIKIFSCRKASHESRISFPSHKSTVLATRSWIHRDPQNLLRMKRLDEQGCLAYGLAAG